MKAKMMKRVLSVMTATVIAAGCFAGCGSAAKETGSTAGSDTDGATSETTSTTGNSAEKTKVTVGIGNAYKPFCYLDENQQECGYDYEVMMAVAEKLSDKYEFVIKPDDFSNLLIGLDTGAYNVAIHHFGYTEERAKNYLYAKEADMYFGNFHIAYVAGRTDITDMKSLTGLTVATTSGSMSDTLIQNWNKQNPDNQVVVEYTGDQEALYSGMMNGLYDAFIATNYDLDVFNSQFDNFMEYSDYNVTSDDYDCGTYFVYSQGADTLQQDIDAAIVKLREDGTLAELSIKLLGDDYSQNPNK